MNNLGVNWILMTSSLSFVPVTFNRAQFLVDSMTGINKSGDSSLICTSSKGGEGCTNTNALFEVRICTINLTTLLMQCFCHVSNMCVHHCMGTSINNWN